MLCVCCAQQVLFVVHVLVVLLDDTVGDRSFVKLKYNFC